MPGSHSHTAMDMSQTPTTVDPVQCVRNVGDMAALSPGDVRPVIFLFFHVPKTGGVHVRNVFNALGFDTMLVTMPQPALNDALVKAATMLRGRRERRQSKRFEWSDLPVDGRVPGPQLLASPSRGNRSTALVAVNRKRSRLVRGTMNIRPSQGAEKTRQQRLAATFEVRGRLEYLLSPTERFRRGHVVLVEVHASRAPTWWNFSARIEQMRTKLHRDFNVRLFTFSLLRNASTAAVSMYDFLCVLRRQELGARYQTECDPMNRAPSVPVMMQTMRNNVQCTYLLAGWIGWTRSRLDSAPRRRPRAPNGEVGPTRDECAAVAASLRRHMQLVVHTHDLDFAMSVLGDVSGVSVLREASRTVKANVDTAEHRVIYDELAPSVKESIAVRQQFDREALEAGVFGANAECRAWIDRDFWRQQGTREQRSTLSSQSH